MAFLVGSLVSAALSVVGYALGGLLRGPIHLLLRGVVNRCERLLVSGVQYAGVVGALLFVHDAQSVCALRDGRQDVVEAGGVRWSVEDGAMRPMDPPAFRAYVTRRLACHNNESPGAGSGHVVRKAAVRPMRGCWRSASALN